MTSLNKRGQGFLILVIDGGGGGDSGGGGGGRGGGDVRSLRMVGESSRPSTF